MSEPTETPNTTSAKASQKLYDEQYASVRALLGDACHKDTPEMPIQEVLYHLDKVDMIEAILKTVNHPELLGTTLRVLLKDKILAAKFKKSIFGAPGRESVLDDATNKFVFKSPNAKSIFPPPQGQVGEKRAAPGKAKGDEGNKSDGKA